MMDGTLVLVSAQPPVRIRTEVPRYVSLYPRFSYRLPQDLRMQKRRNSELLSSYYPATTPTYQCLPAYLLYSTLLIVYSTLLLLRPTDVRLRGSQRPNIALGKINTHPLGFRDKVNHVNLNKIPPGRPMVVRASEKYVIVLTLKILGIRMRSEY